MTATSLVAYSLDIARGRLTARQLVFPFESSTHEFGVRTEENAESETKICTERYSIADVAARRLTVETPRSGLLCPPRPINYISSRVKRFSVTIRNYLT